MNAPPLRCGAPLPSFTPVFVSFALRKACLLSFLTRGARGGTTMTKRTRTQQAQAQWQAQRDERMSSLMQQLEAGVQAIQTSADFTRYLKIAATFHQYSPNNVLLILAQKPEATRVAGYKTWQALGRQVKKGEKAIYIFAPRPYRVTTEDEAGEEQMREGLTFRSVPVFDISQTAGAPISTMEAPALTGDEGEQTYAALVAFATQQGVTVTTHDPNTDGDDNRSSYN